MKVESSEVVMCGGRTHFLQSAHDFTLFFQDTLAPRTSLREKKSSLSVNGKKMYLHKTQRKKRKHNYFIYWKSKDKMINIQEDMVSDTSKQTLFDFL